MMVKVIEARIIVHRGDDYWEKMRIQHDGFTVRAIAKASGADVAAVRNFANRLVKAGFAEKDSKPGLKDTYRLLKSPPVKPRINPDGEVVQETVSETLWRSMRMAKEFSLASLMGWVEGREGKAAESTVRYYLRDLLAVGVIAPADKKAKTFRLVRNLGSRAPRVLSTHVVFDPNSGTAIGSTETFEVQP